MPSRSIPRSSGSPAIRSGLAALALAAVAPAAAALSCPELQDKLEKQLKTQRVEHPPLRIVPKNLVGKARVLGSCENDSQRIIWRDEPAPSPAPGAASSTKK